MSERYLLDTNSFITPYNLYYAPDIAPGYWKQFEEALSSSNVAILDLVRDEIMNGNDDLKDWFSALNNIEDLTVLSRKKEDIIRKYSDILRYIQDSDSYKEEALRKWGDPCIADPWLIAAASARNYTIITFEKGTRGIISTPSKNPKIPDIAEVFGVKTADLYYFMRQKKIIL